MPTASPFGESGIPIREWRDQSIDKRNAFFGTSQVYWLQTKTGDDTQCLRNLPMPSPPPKRVASTYELTASDASPCAVWHQPSPCRQTSRSRNTLASLVPIYNQTSAAAFTRASGSKAFGAAPSTTASAQGKRFPRSPSQDKTGGRLQQRLGRCSLCLPSCAFF